MAWLQILGGPTALLIAAARPGLLVGLVPLGAALVGVGVVGANVLRAAFRMRYVPTAVMARVVSASALITMGTMPLGGLAARLARHPPRGAPDARRHGGPARPRIALGAHRPLPARPAAPGRAHAAAGTLTSPYADARPGARHTGLVAETKVVSAEQVVAAPAEVIFDLIADPARQPEWDGNDNLLQADSGQRVRAAGETFVMITRTGNVRVNHVDAFEEGRLIAWRPGVSAPRLSAIGGCGSSNPSTPPTRWCATPMTGGT